MLFGGGNSYRKPHRGRTAKSNHHRSGLPMIYLFYVFDRHCDCIYDRQFAGSGSINKNNDLNSLKLLFGMLYSLKNLCAKLVANNTLKLFSLGEFRLHFFELATNFKFVLVSDASVDNLQQVLYTLYGKYFVEHVALNPLLPVEFGSGYIRNLNFINDSDAYLKTVG